MKRIKQFFALTPDEMKYLVKSIFWLPITALLLRLVGYQRTLAIYSRDSVVVRPYKLTDQDACEAQTATRMINIAANHGFYHALCLPKSLVLLKFLHQHSIPCQLILGANSQGEAFTAHAWVECGGIVMNDNADVGIRYAKFDSRNDTSG